MLDYDYSVVIFVLRAMALLDAVRAVEGIPVVGAPLWPSSRRSLVELLNEHVRQL